MKMIDVWFGRVIELIECTNLWEDTVVINCSKRESDYADGLRQALKEIEAPVTRWQGWARTVTAQPRARSASV
jgi:hypothetical protein